MVVLRWLLATLLGSVAAAILFILAALVAGPSGGAFGLLLFGFGFAFFPAVFAAGTRSGRSVVRRAAAWFAVLGLIIAGIEGYHFVVGQSLIPAESFAFLQNVELFGARVTAQLAPLFATIVGAFFVLLSIILLLLLRPTGPSKAPSTASTPAARPSTSAPRPAAAGTTASRPAEPAQVSANDRPAAQIAPPAAKPGLVDEDAQLMADLAKLRQKLPKMGNDVDVS